MFTKSLKVLITLLSFFSLLYASDDISLNVIETQRHGSHIFLDIEIQNFYEDTIFLHGDLSPHYYSFYTEINHLLVGGGCFPSSVNFINIEEGIIYSLERLLINYNDTIYLEEILSHYSDEDSISRFGDGKIYYTICGEDLIPLYPESSLILQLHFMLDKEEKKELKYIKFEGSYFIPISGGKLLGKKLKPLEIEVNL